MDMDISMDIHAKSVDMDMDMDGKFHIQGNPGKTFGFILATKVWRNPCQSIQTPSEKAF